VICRGLIVHANRLLIQANKDAIRVVAISSRIFPAEAFATNPTAAVTTSPEPSIVLPQFPRRRCAKRHKLGIQRSRSGHRADRSGSLAGSGQGY
jgi:hypothetical protein